MSKYVFNNDSEREQQVFEWSSELVEKPGPDLSNTGPYFSNSGIPAGLDWLQVSLFGGFSDESWPSLLADLDRARRNAEDSGEWVSARKVNGHDVLVRGAGARHGGFYARWVVRWCGIECHIVAGGKISDTRPTVVVALTSEVLMDLGDRGAWERTLHFLNALGFLLVRDVVSRVDMCLDLVDVGIDSFADPFQRSCFIGDARKRAMYWDGRSTTGFTVGQGKCCLRVYDKVRELREKGSDAKWALLVERWGKEPEKATRIEFQCRREILRERWEVAGVDDLWKKMPTIVKHLCDDWFRMTTEPPRSNNHVRTQILGLWKQVQEKFAKWAGDGPILNIQRVAKAVVPRKLVEQARGCLVTVLASMGRSGKKWDFLLREVHHLLLLERKRLQQDVIVRQRDLIASGRMPVRIGGT